MIGNQLLVSATPTQWRTTQFNYRVINNNRAENDVIIRLRSHNVVVWQWEDNRVVGMAQPRFVFPNVITPKNATTCFWLFRADVNNAVDPESWVTIGPM